MKNTIQAFCTLALLSLLWSCKGRATQKQSVQEIPKPLPTGTKDSISSGLQQSDIRPGHNLVLGQVYTDTIIFREYNDNGDYYLLSGQKNNKEVSLIYDWDQNSLTLNRGDIVKISWKIDSIRLAGDSEVLVFTEKALNAIRIKEGNVSLFRKRYKKEISYHYPDEDYTPTALDRIYRMVEYYIANAENELLHASLNSKEAVLSYSIEQKKEKGKEYTVVGLTHTLDHHSSIIQWLYISFEEKETLYEYNIATGQLAEFN